MVKLSGILEYSMGGFLCLRGFASFKELSKISKENPNVQRKLIEEHKGEMATFLNKGEYRFFPEVVLSASLETDKNYDEVIVDHMNGLAFRTQCNAGWGYVVAPEKSVLVELAVKNRKDREE